MKTRPLVSAVELDRLRQYYSPDHGIRRRQEAVLGHNMAGYGPPARLEVVILCEACDASARFGRAALDGWVAVIDHPWHYRCPACAQAKATEADKMFRQERCASAAGQAVTEELHKTP